MPVVAGKSTFKKKEEKNSIHTTIGVVITSSQFVVLIYLHCRIRHNSYFRIMKRQKEKKMDVIIPIPLGRRTENTWPIIK